MSSATNQNGLGHETTLRRSMRVAMNASLEDPGISTSNGNNNNNNIEQNGSYQNVVNNDKSNKPKTRNGRKKRKKQNNDTQQIKNTLLEGIRKIDYTPNQDVEPIPENIRLTFPNKHILLSQNPKSYHCDDTSEIAALISVGDHNQYSKFFQVMKNSGNHTMHQTGCHLYNFKGKRRQKPFKYRPVVHTLQVCYLVCFSY